MLSGNGKLIRSLIRLGVVCIAPALFAQSGQALRDTLNARIDRAVSLLQQGALDQGNAIIWDCIPKAQEAGIHFIVGRAYHALAGAAFSAGDMDKVRLYANSAFQAYRKTDDKMGMGNAYKIVGVMMLATRQLDSAFYYARESARLYEAIGRTEEVALAYTRMGHVFNLKAEYEKATPYYQRSFDLSSSDTLSSAFMNANLSLACNYIYRKKYDLALRHALTAYSIAQKINAFYEKSNALEYLSHIYEQRGDYKQALTYGQLLMAARDSVLNAQRLRQVKELELKYETAEKQSAIQLLEKDKAGQRTLLWAGAIVLLMLAGGIVLVVRFYRRHNKSLALAQQQTARLLDAEQREAERLLALDVFKSRFFTNISHEFRTPLTVILGMAGQLRTHFSAASNAGQGLDVVQAAGYIQRNGEHLLRLINQLLDLAKLESNTLKMNYIQGNITTYLPYLVESVRSVADERGVMLRTEGPPDAIPMDYDPERLRQVVYNLVANAIKFTPPGGSVVVHFQQSEVTEPAKDGSPVALKFTVSDTGMGIAPADLPNIFDRFYQASRNPENAAGGSGIGLSLTRELVRAMGGDITVRSELGKGAEFTVTLPITKRAPITPDLLPMRTEAGVPEAIRLPQTLSDDAGSPEALPVLLIVEDNADVADFLQLSLRNHYQLSTAANGREGLEMALEMVPDLILSDVMMPEMDGLELCDRLKNDERTSHIPVVLLTAKADVESRVAGLRRGADAYLAKPFYQEELNLILSNLLALRLRWQQRFSSSGMGGGTPDLSPEDLAPEHTFLKKIREQMEQHWSDIDFDGPQLARALLLSEVQLYRKLKALTGKSTAIYMRSLRLHKALELLRSSRLSISEIAYDVGFRDPNYFSRTFSQEFGMPPSEAR